MPRVMTEAELIQRRSPRRKCLDGCHCGKHSADTARKTLPEYSLKSCGQRHAFCKECRPDLGIGGIQFHKMGCQCPWCCSRIGTDNPAWRGGPGSGYAPGWKAARKAVWTRDFICRVCGLSPASNRRLDVHHIVERRNGGTNDLDNLVGLHHGCHMKVHHKSLAVA